MPSTSATPPRFLAAASTPPAHQPSDPLALIRSSIITCELCPRLRNYCTAIGETRRRAYLHQTYWARPNRTGRPFTGDGSGDFMYPVLHSLGFSTQPRATSRDDGLQLRDAWIASVVRCAPPGDKPAPEEIRNCSRHLAAEIAHLPRVQVVVCLGRIAWDGYLAHLVLTGVIARRSLYTFAHGAEYALPNGLRLLASYHPSLRNTNTGRLNSVMFEKVFVRARELTRKVHSRSDLKQVPAV